MCGVGIGLALAIPLGVLLSYPAFLPTMLGLFFFLLFGLLIGAAMFRVWSPLRPLPLARIKQGALMVALCGWLVSLVWEGATFPAQAAKEAIRQVTKPVAGKTPDDIKADARASARAFLAERYPPGGVLGYWRWAVTGTQVDIPITGVVKPRAIRLGNTGTLFVIRALLSGVALAAGIWLMVKPLGRVPMPEDEPPAEAVIG